MNKKIVEIIAGLIFTVACIGVIVWFYVSSNANNKLQESSAAPSVSLKKISVLELESIESNSLSALKNLKIFGKIPVRSSGSERSKTNLFTAEDQNNEKGKFKSNKYIVEYPGSWVQNIQKNDKDTNIIFEAPIADGFLQTKGTVLVLENNSSIKDHASLETTLKSQLTTNLGISDKDLSGYNIESSDTDKSKGVIRGRIKFSYKDGQVTKTGWIGGLAHQSPSKKLSESIYKLILANKDKSTFLKQVAPTIENSQESMAKVLQNKAITDELASLDKDITYNIKPYDIVLMFLLETKKDDYDDLKAGADYIYTHTDFIETASGSAVE